MRFFVFIISMVTAFGSANFAGAREPEAATVNSRSRYASSTEKTNKECQIKEASVLKEVAEYTLTCGPVAPLVLDFLLQSVGARAVVTKTVTSGLTSAATWAASTSVGKAALTTGSVASVPAIAIFAVGVTGYAIYKDSQCFNDNDQKLKLMEASNKVAEYIKASLKDPNDIDSYQWNKIRIPMEIYKNRRKKMSCQRLQEMLTYKKQQQDILLANLISRKKLKNSKLKPLPESALRQMAQKWSCMSKGDKIKAICTAGDTYLLGKELPNIFKLLGQKKKTSTNSLNNLKGVKARYGDAIPIGIDPDEAFKTLKAMEDAGIAPEDIRKALKGGKCNI